jgi:chemotaxis protein MotB
VLDYLVERGAIPASRTSIAGYAHHQPLAPNDTTEDRAKNRRVEVVFLRSKIERGPNL